MAQVLVQLPEEMIEALDRVAPASARLRSRFIRLAIQKALMELEDARTRDAYLRLPDGEPPFDARAWGEWQPARRRRKRA